MVPAPSGQTPQPVPQPLATGQPPQVHTPQPLAPNQSTPSPMQLTPGQTPMQLTPGQVSQPVAPPSSGALKWVLIIGGSLIGLCCLCGVVGQAIGGFDKQNQFGGVDNAVPTIEDVPSEPVAPVVPALPSVKEKAGLDPNGTEIYDSLKIDRSAIEEASQVLQNTPEIPSTEQIRQLAEESGASPADVKKVVAGAKRLNELRTKWKSKGTLTKADAEEVLRLMDVLDNL